MDGSGTPQSDSPVSRMLNELAAQLEPATVGEFIDIYVDNSAKQLEKIQDAQNRGDLETVVREAHSLKSSSANLGIHALSEICLKLEKTKTLNDSAQALIDEARALHRNALEEMRQWKENALG